MECVDVVECSEHGKADKQYFTAFCESHASILLELQGCAGPKQKHGLVP